VVAGSWTGFELRKEAVVTSPASSSLPPIDVVRRAFDGLNQRDLDVLRTVMADDVVEHVVPVGVHDGPQEVLAYYKEVFAAFPDLRADISAIAQAEETVLVAWEMIGTFKGAPFQRVEPTGKRMRLEGASVHIVRSGRVASAQIIYDGASFARQVGMLPARGSRADRALIAAFNAKTKLQKRLGRG
jgi:steroid delta-isomerase-like uncharacterized protein